MYSPDPIHPHEICHIVFDLGGVLYAIDPSRTTAALMGLAGPGARHMEVDDPLFQQFEMGLISPQQFRADLRAALDSRASDAELDAAWNALLLGPIAGRLDAIREFSKQYTVVLLSNTNVIHQEIWGPQCADMFASMRATFFSFDKKLRKPDPQIYWEVLAEMDFEYFETLFVDDSASNIAGAREVGLRTLLIDPTSPNQFSEFCLKFLGKL